MTANLQPSGTTGTSFWRTALDRAPEARGDWDAAMRYGVAVALVLVATAATAVVAQFHPSHPFLYAYYAAIVAATWFGGLGPGSLTAVLATLTAEYFWVPPFDSFGVEDGELPDFLAFVAFAAVSVAVAAAIRHRASPP